MMDDVKELLQISDNGVNGMVMFLRGGWYPYVLEIYTEVLQIKWGDT